MVSTPAGALTLTPRYKTCAFNTFVARCNESREERANEAPAKEAKPPLALFHSDAFRQVTGLVYVGAFYQRYVVRQQLKSNHVQHGRKQAVVLRHH